MGWRIAVTSRAAAQIRSLDGLLRDELIDRVARLAEAPAEFLVRSAAPEFPGLYVHAYTSEVLSGLTVTVYFDRFDDEPQRLVLVAVAQVGDGAVEEE